MDRDRRRDPREGPPRLYTTEDRKRGENVRDHAHSCAIERPLLCLKKVTGAQAQVLHNQDGLERHAATTIGSCSEQLVRANCADLPESERLNQVEYIARKPR
jgi:hypothetical protein